MNKPRKKKSKTTQLSPDDLIAELDKHFTRADPDESERRDREWFSQPEPNPEDLFPPEA